jgi:hypothetical protein
MSRNQWGTLRFIATHDVNTQHIRLFNMITLGSLLHRGWVERKLGLIVLTRAGQEVFTEYLRATANYRKQEGDLSERVALMLHLNSIEGAS